MQRTSGRVQQGEVWSRFCACFEVDPKCFVLPMVEAALEIDHESTVHISVFALSNNGPFLLQG